MKKVYLTHDSLSKEKFEELKKQTIKKAEMFFDMVDIPLDSDPAIRTINEIQKLTYEKFKDNLLANYMADTYKETSQWN